MWICKNNSFLSIVLNTEKEGELLVRARLRGDIEAVFPQAVVIETPAADYLFRTSLPKKEVVTAIAESIFEIDYPNFKDSVEDKERHDAYLEFWFTMYRLQNSKYYGDYVVQ